MAVACKKKKKIVRDLNCSTPAWRSELLPTGLLGSVNRCVAGLMYGETKLTVYISRTKAKIKKHFLVAQWVRAQIPMLKYSSSNPLQDTFFSLYTHRFFFNPYFGQFFLLSVAVACKKNKKKIVRDLNCSTPAWRSELLPTELLGSVNRCVAGLMYGETKLTVYISRTKAKIKNPIVFFLVRSRATCTCKIKP